jgi:hypothetical protein
MHDKQSRDANVYPGLAEVAWARHPAGGLVELRKVFRVMSTVALLAADVSFAQSDTVTDCVGQMQLTLPGAAEMAVASKTYLEHQFSAFKRLNASPPWPFQFSDGGIAAFSHLQGIAVTAVGQSLDAHDIKALRQAYVRDREAMANRANSGSVKRSVERLALGANVDASRTAWRGAAVVEIGERLALLSADADRSLSDQQQSKKVSDALRAGVKKLTVRPFGSVPDAAGLCLPYAFISDDGASYRDIAVTYRLREHPDVTILIKDVVAAKLDGDQGERAKLAQYRIDDFWSQYASGTSGLKSAWSSPYRSYSVEGRSGLKSFVRFVRPDGTEDFGFAAAVPGNAKAKVDEPDVMLYVVRDAKVAKSKGLVPIDAEVLQSMAEEVAASIRHRSGQ